MFLTEGYIQEKDSPAGSVIQTSQGKTSNSLKQGEEALFQALITKMAPDVLHAIMAILPSLTAKNVIGEDVFNSEKPEH